MVTDRLAILPAQPIERLMQDHGLSEEEAAHAYIYGHMSAYQSATIAAYTTAKGEAAWEKLCGEDSTYDGFDPEAPFADLWARCVVGESAFLESFTMEKGEAAWAKVEST